MPFSGLWHCSTPPGGWPGVRTLVADKNVQRVEGSCFKTQSGGGELYDPQHRACWASGGLHTQSSSPDLTLQLERTRGSLPPCLTSFQAHPRCGTWWSRAQASWVSNPISLPHFSTCATLDKLLNLSQPQRSPLNIGRCHGRANVWEHSHGPGTFLSALYVLCRPFKQSKKAVLSLATFYR